LFVSTLPSILEGAIVGLALAVSMPLKARVVEN
jgi:hypothetical protein